MSGTPAGHPQRTLDPISAVLMALVLIVLAVDLAVVVTVDYRAPLSAVLREFAFATSWLVVGAVALAVRRVALGRRVLTLSLVLVANFVGSFGLASDELVPRMMVTVTAFLVPLQTPVAGHLLLAYPTGVLPGRGARRVVAVGYGLGFLESLWWGLSHTGLSACDGCAVSYTSGAVPASWTGPVATLFSALWVPVVVAFLVQAVLRYGRAGPRQRRLLRLPYLALLVVTVLYAVLSVLAAIKGTSAWGLSTETVILVQVVGLLGVPLCFLVGLLNERLSFKRIGELVVTLAGGAGTDLERSLCLALGDPHLRVVFPVADGFVDTQGRLAPALVPDHRTAVTAVGDHEAPMALISHDRSLSEEPALLTAAGSATRLILENARLQAEVRAQLLEVRESRTRIVTATNEARVRLERDLHDGAQQRLLAIGIALQLLRQQPRDTTLLEAAESELSSALAEMRELASGIHPAVLTDLGLVAALQALAGRLGPRVRLDVPAPVRRCSPEVEAAAYFSATEAITNSLKHAAPAPVDVTVVDRDDRLVVQVHDDGPGGADVTGSGLLGVRDRLAAVDGTLTVTSPEGRGTELTMEIPCA
jgi:signal transduction histidine kinase